MKAIKLLLLFTWAFDAAGQAGFPADWQGHWQGRLEIFNASGKVQEIPMELHLLPMDTSANYTFTIIYGEDKEAGKRPYELVVLDAGKGRYLIDEKNTIKMEAYLVGGKLVQWFEVEGSLLYSSLELVGGEQLVWEILAGSSAPASSSGGTKVDGEDIPVVKAYPIGTLQKAVLRRQG